MLVGIMVASPPGPILRIIGLTKKYGRRLALNDLSLEVFPGRVYGFLGPNGAGKTTAINLVLSLIAPTNGRVELFGLDVRESHREALRRTGAVLEGAPFYADLSARDNLRVWGPLSGGVSRKRIEEVLGLVGLAARAGEKVRTFSLGMKQRLALAAALMHNPELLILDEPTNGLDPAGMREFRDLFRELGRAGKTLFVSSHLLSEVQQMCDEVGILKEGRLIAQGPVAELLRRGESLEVEATNPDKAMQVLESQEWVRAVTRQDSRLLVETPRERAADVSRVLAEHQVYLRELRPRESSLEEFFLEVTGQAEKS